MQYIRKSVSIVLIAVILLLSTSAPINAQTTIIYQTNTSQTITSGAVQKNIIRYTEKGWYNINVLDIDFTNPNVKVDTLANQSSINTLTTTKDLAKNSGAVAAINGGFFSFSSGSHDAPMVQSGSLVTAASDFNTTEDSKATFAIDNLNQMLYQYWKINMTLSAPNGKTAVVGRFNKPFYGHRDDLTIIDRRMSDKTIGTDTPTRGCADIIEMIVVNDKVVEIRKGQPAVKIPENGYVVIGREKFHSFFIDNFKVGDPVKLDISTNIDLKNTKTAITGGSILVKDGKLVSKFSFEPSDIKGNQPRTAIGTSQDGKHLLLVTVDGRQNSSIGMSHTEMAELMLELKAYHALSMDGGGSTTMIARKPGTEELAVVNSPSEGSLRKISNALGIFSIAPPSELEGLIIDTIDDNIFVNTSRSFTVRGYDKYFNPIKVDPASIKWSATGVRGTFEGNLFKPQTMGSGKIVATVGKVTASLDIAVLSSPVQLMLSKKSLTLLPNQIETLKVTGKNRYGYYATIDPKDLKWNIHGNFGTVKDGIFTAAAAGGSGYIDAFIGNTHAYCTVSVLTDVPSVIDEFDILNGSFLSYPTEIQGTYDISEEQAHSGKSSGKLTYNFPESDKPRAAYLLFPGEGIIADKNVQKIGLWVYNEKAGTSQIKMILSDARGNQHLVDLAGANDWTGWKYVEASTKGLEAPLLLKRIYIVKTDSPADSGALFLDDLTFTHSTYPVVDMSKVPKDTQPVDEAQKTIVNYTRSQGSFRFSVFGESREPAQGFEKQLSTKLTESINKNIDASVFIGNSKHEMAKAVKKPVLPKTARYDTFDMGNSRFIQLDTQNQSLRLPGTTAGTYSAVQWKWFFDQMNSAKGKNIFLFLSNHPETFKDKLEADLFQDILVQYKKKTGKNIWVFYKGDKNTSYMERGIKYISSAGFDAPGISDKNIKEAKYILVTVKGSLLSFEFKSIS